MSKKILILPYLILLLIISIFFYLLITDRDPSAIPSVLINKEFPKLEAKSLLNSEKFIFKNELMDEITIVNFFASWCKPCRDEHAFIKKFTQEKNIKVIGINYKDNPKKAIKWLEKYDNPYSNIAIDRNGIIAIEWGVYGIPETFIINKNGIILYRHVGPINRTTYNKINSIIENEK
jgi:cytochrome c biogenesis protein CcmG/thiol:disulfide interchange protein DsbE